VESDISKLLEQPVKISDDKIAFISQYLSDSTILKKRKE
jgi:energy-converting hydrogenase B subunit L